MSAPKRSEKKGHPALPAASDHSRDAAREAAMAERKAGQTEIPDAWIQQFKERVAEDRKSARGAWKKLDEAGLEEGALLLLRGYAGGAKDAIDRMHRRAEYASRRIKAARRAEKVAQDGAPSRAHNPDLFRERAVESRQDAHKAEWPAPSASVRTVGDELALASEAKGREIPLDAARRALVKAAGKRSPVNSFYFLFLLQGYAKKHRVTLGIKRLIALASCADRDRFLDKGALGRCLRDIPESVKEDILRDTLPKLPPPALPKL